MSATDKKKWRIFALWILFSEAVGITAGILTRNDTVIYSTEITKPMLAPPPLLFPVVWTILYALMGFGASKIFLAPASKERTQGLRLFLAQLFFNFCWCFLFFSAQAFGTAFLWLVILILLVAKMIITFRKISPLASGIQVPYLLWLIFAGYLNFAVWLLN